MKPRQVNNSVNRNCRRHQCRFSRMNDEPIRTTIEHAVVTSCIRMHDWPCARLQTMNCEQRVFIGWKSIDNDNRLGKREL